MRIHDLTLQKLQLNLPSIASRLLTEEYTQKSNVREALCKILQTGTTDSVSNSFSYKPSKYNLVELNIITVGAVTVVSENILGSDKNLAFTIPTITLTKHTSASLEHISFNTSSLVSELRSNPVSVEIITRNTKTADYEKKVIEEVLNDFSFSSLLKGWGVDVLLTKGSGVLVPERIKQIGIDIGNMSQCENQRKYIEKLSGIQLCVETESEITREAIRALSPCRSVNNVVISEGIGNRVVYAGQRERPSSIVPMKIDIQFQNQDRSIWFNQFLSQHIKQIDHTESVDRDFNVPIDHIERAIIASQSEAENIWLSGLDE